MISKQYPYEVYVFRNRVNHLRERSQVFLGERVNLIQEKIPIYQHTIIPFGMLAYTTTRKVVNYIYY